MSGRISVAVCGAVAAAVLIAGAVSSAAGVCLTVGGSGRRRIVRVSGAASSLCLVVPGKEPTDCIYSVIHIVGLSIKYVSSLWLGTFIIRII